MRPCVQKVRMHSGIEKVVLLMFSFGALNNRKIMGERTYTSIEMDNRSTMFSSCCRYCERITFEGGELVTLCISDYDFFC